MPTGERLPGVPGGDERIVLHVDVDCFYAACERLREPELRGEPVVVGMGYEPGGTHGAVATASYEAREHGVESAQAITEALELLPRVEDADPDEPAAHYRPVDMEFYEAVSEDVRSIVEDLADTLRVVSVDEAYLDVTERTDWDVAEGFGRHVRDRIRREVGVTASVGVAPTMSAAKVASDHDKPDGLVVVEPGAVAEFLAPLPVEDIHGVGPVRAGELREMGVETAGDLAATPLPELADAFGDRGREIGRRARGEDDREVTPRGKPKSLSRESAFAEAVEAPDPKRERVRSLAAAVGDRAHRRGALYRTIGIKAVEPPFEVNTRERSLPGPIEDPALLTEVAADLFEEFENCPVRKVGVRVSNLVFPEGEQTSLEGYGDGGGASEDPLARGRGSDQTSLTDF
jgi:DNA polymerase IV (DinB-like DNA polymerase)